MPLSPFGNNFCVIFLIAVRNHTGMMLNMTSRQSQPQAVFMGLPMRAPGSSGKGIRRDRMDLSGSIQPQGFSEPLGGSCRTNALRGTGVMPFTRQRSKKELGSKLQKGETPNCHFWVSRLSLKQNLRILNLLRSDVRRQEYLGVSSNSQHPVCLYLGKQSTLRDDLVGSAFPQPQCSPVKPLRYVSLA